MTDVHDLEVPPDAPETDERCRSIERGARLITVMPTTFALVLQMPRGNLETIYPRALVLSGIRKSIAAKQYKRGFLACRNHRVDMNILHDHDPQQFMSSVGLFVDQVKKVEYIDLFLSQLREEDVSQIMYKETLRNPNRTESLMNQEVSALKGIDGFAHASAYHAQDKSKINRICDAFLNALKGRLDTNLQNVVTAHVCKSPPDLDAGLSLVAKLRGEDMAQAEKAVEHICFLADVNKLYDHALGLYDLDLTLLVAQQSQKDPREYLPFLQNLQAMSILRRQYTIDDHLGRHTRALQHLHDLDAFDELKAYTIKHKLYKHALGLCRYQEARLNEIMRLYADNLNSESKYKEAGLAYEYLSDHGSASEAYRLAHMWRESLSSASLLHLHPAQLHTLATTLADTLIESKDYFSAATIHLDYLSSLESAARLFCKGYFFAEATRVIALHKRPDLFESILDVGLVDGLAGMTELLAECKAQVNAQVPRVRELRTKKAEDPLSFFDGTGGAADGLDIPDNVSLAATDASTTGGSLFTRYTNRSTGTLDTQTTRRTSRNRRREERKRARGKKGSVYEEEYLVNSIGRLVERVDSVAEEVERLVVGLLRRGMRERALAVEGAMVEVVGLLKGCVGEVFEVEEKVAGKVDGGVEDGEEGRPSGANGVFWDSIEEKAKRKDPPVVKDFEKLSLLGA
ncbi:MAG: hypothetical protein M1830_010585 [Pleopsidium flavum]|nr:MAG: hypothetical protein M1830_010585 [Pleopsidium flavum]